MGGILRPTPADCWESDLIAGPTPGAVLTCVPTPKGEETLREIEAGRVTASVRDLCIEANTELPASHLSALRRALDSEESPLGREVIERLLQNAEVAKERCVAFCQDTGYAGFFRSEE